MSIHLGKCCERLNIAQDQVVHNGDAEVMGCRCFQTAIEIMRQKPNSEMAYDELDIYMDFNDLLGKNNGIIWSNPMDLASIPLRESSTVSVHVARYNSDIDAGASTNSDELNVIHTSFLLAGLQGTSEQKIDSDDGTWTRVLTAQKVSSISQPGSVKAVAITKKALPRKDVASTTNTTKVTISLYDDGEKNEMIDEDDLLQDEGDLAPPLMPLKENVNASANDCGGRTACDDCTCGRRDAEEHQQVSKAPIKSSACGKCGLGDAFRCASCPYLGKPAFKAGEEHLVLDLQDDF
jgi:Cytokine-induced anti-apoptosis inhibitor 1, Fe-S biogenesis